MAQILMFAMTFAGWGSAVAKVFSQTSNVQLLEASLPPTADSPAVRYLFARLEGEPLEQSLGRYVRLFNSLRSLSNIRRGRYLKTEDFRVRPFELVHGRVQGRSRVLMMANQYDDMVGGARIRRNVAMNASQNAESFVIPLIHNLGLSEGQAQAYRNQTFRAADVLELLGGEDVDPSVYGDTLTWAHAHQINLVRDRSAQTYIRQALRWVEERESMQGVDVGLRLIVAICRGYQELAVALGHGLIQDLTKEGAADGKRHGRLDEPVLSDKQAFHSILVTHAFLRELMGLSTSHTLVNSVHHQAVLMRQGARGVVAAVDDESGLPEAILYSGQITSRPLALGFQWHPEFPPSISKNDLFSYVNNRMLGRLFRYASGQNRIESTPCHDILRRSS